MSLENKQINNRHTRFQAPDSPSPAALDILRRFCRPEDVREMIYSQTTIDVGLWFRWRRIWVCGIEDRLILLADGPRPYAQSAMYHELRTSFYSHPSGELVCVPAPELAVHSLAMGPAAAWRMLGLIHGTVRASAGSMAAGLLTA
jgi:hypothetical protein